LWVDLIEFNIKKMLSLTGYFFSGLGNGFAHTPNSQTSIFIGPFTNI